MFFLLLFNHPFAPFLDAREFFFFNYLSHITQNVEEPIHNFMLSLTLLVSTSVFSNLESQYVQLRIGRNITNFCHETLSFEIYWQIFIIFDYQVPGSSRQLNNLPSEENLLLNFTVPLKRCWTIYYKDGPYGDVGFYQEYPTGIRKGIQGNKYQSSGDIY